MRWRQETDFCQQTSGKQICEAAVNKQMDRSSLTATIILKFLCQEKGDSNSNRLTLTKTSFHHHPGMQYFEGDDKIPSTGISNHARQAGEKHERVIKTLI